MTRTKEEHASYMREYYRERPEQLAKKRQRDRERYQEKKDERLAYQKEYYLANGERVRQRIKETSKIKRDKLRQEAIAHLGGKCMDCSIDNILLLQFHHRPGTVKLGEVTSLASSEKKFWNEVAKCDLVCANCHLLRHYD